MAALLQNVVKEEYSVKIVVFYRVKREVPTTEEPICLNLPPKKTSMGKIVQAMLRIIRFQQTKRKHKPDIVISFGTTANYVNILSGGNDKKIVSFRGYASLQKSLVNTLCCKKANAIYCISKGMCDKLKEIYPEIAEKVELIYNGCDIEKVRSSSQEFVASSSGSPVVVSLGRVVPIKGYRHLVHAFAMFRETYPNSHLLIIGGGEYEGQLTDLIKELKLSNCVHILGEQVNPYPYLKTGDIYVQTSISEGFLNTLIEAFALNIPVISTDCKSGPREILGGLEHYKRIETAEYAKYGILVPPFESNDSDESEKEKILADAMTELIRNKELYEKYRDSAQECADRFSTTAYKSSINRLISRYLGECRTSETGRH